MRHKVFHLWIAVCMSFFLMSACVSVKKDQSKMPKKEKAELFLQMGVRYLSLGKLKTAKDKLETALQLDSRNMETYNALGVLNERLKQYDEAQAYYQKALSIDSEDASLSNNYGRFLCERGDYEAGVALLNYALELPLNNRRWFAYTNMGRCEDSIGNVELAELNFRKALQENRNYSPALLEMQKISFQKGKYMSSRAFLERYLQGERHTVESLWVGVQTELLLGNTELAEKYREQLTSQFPLSEEAKMLSTRIE